MTVVMSECLWLKFHCDRCGDYDIALGSADAIPETCCYCHGERIVVDYCKGRTTRPLPYSAPPMKALHGTYVEVKVSRYHWKRGGHEKRNG